MNLFFKLCRARTIAGVTGSNGKTTTTTLAGEVWKRRPGRCWIGGNIGVSLLERVDEIAPEDLVLLELSSFQLEHLGVLGRSPSASAVLNLTPNHLDRHGTMEAYGNAKKNILRGKGAVGILNADCPVVSGWTDVPANPLAFGRRAPVGRGACLAGGWISIVQDGDAFPVIPASALRVPGLFNVENALAAACVSWVLGATKDGIAQGLADFRGVEHRLETAGVWGGVTWINDSIATNPDSTLAALRTLSQPLVLILGGHDKGLSFDSLASAAAARCRAIVLVGASTAKIADALARAGCAVPVDRATDFRDAVALASGRAQRGDAVLLSPACASFDMFRNFEDRGRRFKSLARELAGARAGFEEKLAGIPERATA
jgi:UDP-N-acetylmuramoylalanine--D-glutamate ligase